MDAIRSASTTPQSCRGWGPPTTGRLLRPTSETRWVRGGPASSWKPQGALRARSRLTGHELAGVYSLCATPRWAIDLSHPGWGLHCDGLSFNPWVRPLQSVSCVPALPSNSGCCLVAHSSVQDTPESVCSAPLFPHQGKLMLV